MIFFLVIFGCFEYQFVYMDGEMSIWSEHVIIIFMSLFFSILPGLLFGEILHKETRIDQKQVNIQQAWMTTRKDDIVLCITYVIENSLKTLILSAESISYHDTPMQPQVILRTKVYTPLMSRKWLFTSGVEKKNGETSVFFPKSYTIPHEGQDVDVA